MKFSEIELMKIIQKFNFSKQMKFISSPFNTSGFIILIISLYIYNILNNNDIKLLVIITIYAIIIKLIFKRKRPYRACSDIRNYTGTEYNNIMDMYSFPSGHTVAATIFSLIMLSKYPTEFIFNIVAILVGFSRIFLGVHYPSDIIGGMVFGFLFYKIFV